VAKGFLQKEGFDYTETFAPVSKMTTIRSLLVIANELDMSIRQLDVKTAFLNGEIEEEIFMIQPPGYIESGKAHLVCKLQKSLYGLKQAPRAWNIVINKALHSFGFKQADQDPCLFTRRVGTTVMFLGLFVDDIILASNNQKETNKVVEHLSKLFDIKDLGDLEYFLGIKIERSKNFLHLTQRKYIEGMLKKFNMEDCKPVSTPSDPKVRLSKDMCPTSKDDIEEMEVVPYREAVGSILFLMVATRPDLSYAISSVLQIFSKSR
jgi:hypothetical protein